MVEFEDDRIDRKYASVYRTDSEYSLAHSHGVVEICGSFQRAQVRYGSPAQPAYVGDEVQVKGLRMRLNQVETTTYDRMGRLAPEAMYYLILDFSLMTVRERYGLEIRRGNFSLKSNTQDEIYKVVEIDIQDQLQSHEMRQTESIAGKIAFEVSSQFSDFVLKYRVEDEYDLAFTVRV